MSVCLHRICCKRAVHGLLWRREEALAFVSGRHGLWNLNSWRLACEAQVASSPYESGYRWRSSALK